MEIAVKQKNIKINPISQYRRIKKHKKNNPQDIFTKMVMIAEKYSWILAIKKKPKKRGKKRDQRKNALTKDV